MITCFVNGTQRIYFFFIIIITTTVNLLIKTC